MNIELILLLVAIVYFLLFAGVYLLKSRKKGWIMTLVRLGMTLAAAVIAIPVCKLGVGLVTDILYDLLVPMLGETINSFMNAVPVGAEGMRTLVALIAAPSIYPAVFMLIHRIFLIIAWILEKLVPALRPRSCLAVSLPVGALNGLLLGAVLLIPVCGLMTMGSHMITTLVSADSENPSVIQEEILGEMDVTEEDVWELADTMENHIVVSAIHKTIGKPIYNALTTTKLDTSDTHGEVIEMNLETELCGLVKTAGYAVEVMDSFEKEDYTDADKELLYATADSFFESEWVRMLATDTLVAMSDSWLKGEEFAGMVPPSLDSALQPTLDCVLTILSTETADTLEEDIHDILDVVGDLLVHDLLNTDGDYTVLVQKLGTSGLLTDMMVKLQENERLSVLATELKSLSIRLVTNMLGTEQLREGQYADMMGNVAGTLTDSLDLSKEERDALVVESVQEHFADEGYDVPPEVVVEMTDQIVTDLGGDGEITSDELTDYFVNHSDEMADILPEDLPDGDA